MSMMVESRATMLDDEADADADLPKLERAANHSDDSSDGEPEATQPPPSATTANTSTSSHPTINKARKPYTVSKPRETWTGEEHHKFIEALSLFDRDWKRIGAHIGTKSIIQIRSHAQKYFIKMQKMGLDNYIPPPRPKKRAKTVRDNVSRGGNENAGNTSNKVSQSSSAPAPRAENNVAPAVDSRQMFRALLPALAQSQPQAAHQQQPMQSLPVAFKPNVQAAQALSQPQPQQQPPAQPSPVLANVQSQAARAMTAAVVHPTNQHPHPHAHPHPHQHLHPHPPQMAAQPQALPPAPLNYGAAQPAQHTVAPPPAYHAIAAPNPAVSALKSPPQHCAPVRYAPVVPVQMMPPPPPPPHQQVAMQPPPPAMHYPHYAHYPTQPLAAYHPHPSHFYQPQPPPLYQPMVPYGGVPAYAPAPVYPSTLLYTTTPDILSPTHGPVNHSHHHNREMVMSPPILSHAQSTPAVTLASKTSPAHSTSPSAHNAVMSLSHTTNTLNHASTGNAPRHNRDHSVNSTTVTHIRPTPTRPSPIITNMNNDTPRAANNDNDNDGEGDSESEPQLPPLPPQTLKVEGVVRSIAAAGKRRDSYAVMQDVSLTLAALRESKPDSDKHSRKRDNKRLTAGDTTDSDSDSDSSRSHIRRHKSSHSHSHSHGSSNGSKHRRQRLKDRTRKERATHAHDSDDDNDDSIGGTRVLTIIEPASRASSPSMSPPPRSPSLPLSQSVSGMTHSTAVEPLLPSSSVVTPSSSTTLTPMTVLTPSTMSLIALKSPSPSLQSLSPGVFDPSHFFQSTASTPSPAFIFNSLTPPVSALNLSLIAQTPSGSGGGIGGALMTPSALSLAFHRGHFTPTPTLK